MSPYGRNRKRVKSESDRMAKKKNERIPGKDGRRKKRLKQC